MLYTRTELLNKLRGHNTPAVGAPTPVTNETKYHISGGQFTRVCVYYNEEYGLAYGFEFDKILDAGGVRIYRDYIRVVNNTQVESDYNHLERTHSVGDSDVLTQTNGGFLLDLANDFKDEFFAGVTQTPELLFAFMQQKYGNAYGFWCNQNVVSMPVWEMAQMDVSTSSAIEYDRAECNGFNQFYPGAWEFIENNYGNVATTYPASADTDPKKLRYVMAKLIFSDINPRQDSALHFDVYIQGTKGPTIDIKWKAINAASNFSLQAVVPNVYRLWAGPSYMESSFYVENEQLHYSYPNMNVFAGKKGFTFSQSDHYVFPAQFENDTAGMTAAEKIAKYGVDAIANYLFFALQFEYKEYMSGQEIRRLGQIMQVKIPYERTDNGECEVVTKSGTAYNENFTTTCTLHFSAPPEDEEDEDEDDDPPPPPPVPPGYDPPFEEDEPQGFPGHAILTQTYACTAAILENVGAKLWSQSYWDVLKIQSNPIENIISCKWFPMNLDGVAREIKVGNIGFGINGYIRENRYVSSWLEYTYTGNEATWTDGNGRTHSLPKFLCCSPYTMLKLHLPYAGTVQLDASDIINNPLRVRYVVDLVTGDMLYFLQIGKTHAPYMTVAGKMGVDIPLTATNRAAVEMSVAGKQLSAVLGAGVSLLQKDVVGAVNNGLSFVQAAGSDYTSQRTATHSPMCASFENTAIYLEISFPKYTESPGFKNVHGYVAHSWRKLSTCKGFVMVDSRTKIDAAMTNEENDMIEKLLVGGVYIK